MKFRWLYDLLNLLLYSNLWIACCALALSWQTHWLFTGAFSGHPLYFFIAAATLFLYALHRIVGLEKVSDFRKKGRYRIVSKFRHHIFWYGLTGGVTAFLLFWRLDTSVQIALIVPTLLSLGYVIPIFKQNSRLRDFHYIKIFLLAGVWAWVTVVLPALQFGFQPLRVVVLLFLERLCFIFALGLLFDIRDLNIDRYTAVKTLPTKLGVPATQCLSYSLLLAMVGISVALWQAGFYSYGTVLAIATSAVVSAVLVYFSASAKHDYFFAGLVDSAMLVQAVLVWGWG